MKSKEATNVIEEREKEKHRQFVNNRRKRFIDLLGEDCGYIDALVINTSISPWDVKELLDNNCPKDLIPKILL